MDIGIFAKTFRRRTVEATLDAVRAHGLKYLQFNMACAGLPSLPEEIHGGLCERIRRAFAVRGLRMAAVSGTFNMIHPDPAMRADGLRRLAVLAGACRDMGTSIVTLSTGTRDPDDPWRRHPDNDSASAWSDLIMAMRQAVRIAEEHAVTLAFEPEVANVVNSAQKGRQLLDEIGSSRLKVVMDGANLFHTGQLPRVREVLDEAFALLGKDIVLAHAKDLNRDGEAGHVPAGQGVLDYDHYLALLREVGYDGPLILHALTEAQVDECSAFLRGKFSEAAGAE
jgi:sugar phosphate isomerase/epimerase